MKNTTCKIAIIHKLILFFKTVASSETDVAGLAQLWSFPSNLPLKDAGNMARVNHSFFRTVAYFAQIT